MNLEQLEERDLSIEDIYLDPNNPRFWSEQTRRDIPDRKIPDQDVQIEAMARIESHGIQELADSMLRNGFLPLDRIVVREIEGHEDAYVVVEGNRRVAALRKLRKKIEQGIIAEEGIDDEDLEAFRSTTDVIRVLVYTGDDAKDVSWLLQGIRHISGIRDWQPAQRAKLVADQIEREGLGLREAGQRFGLTAQAVGRLYRSLKALEQMRADDEFASQAKNEWFTLFEESIRNIPVRKWLGWDDNEKRFTNIDELRQFYSWITPDPDNEGRRRIHDPRQIKKLGVLVSGPHQDLLSRIDAYELTIDTAADRVEQTAERYDWREAIAKATQILKDIPQSAIADSPAEILEQLEAVGEILGNLRAMAEAVRQS